MQLKHVNDLEACVCGREGCWVVEVSVLEIGSLNYRKKCEKAGTDPAKNLTEFQAKDRYFQIMH